MIKQNKILLTIILISALVALFLNFKKYVVDKDYILYMNAPCDIEGKCFIVKDAIDDEVFNDEPYLKMYRNHAKVEHCLETGSCDVFVCEEGEEGCEQIYCSEEMIEEGEECI